MGGRRLLRRPAAPHRLAGLPPPQRALLPGDVTRSTAGTGWHARLPEPPAPAPSICLCSPPGCGEGGGFLMKAFKEPSQKREATVQKCHAGLPILRSRSTAPLSPSLPSHPSRLRQPAASHQDSPLPRHGRRRHRSAPALLAPHKQVVSLKMLHVNGDSDGDLVQLHPPGMAGAQLLSMALLLGRSHPSPARQSQERPTSPESDKRAALNRRRH